VASHHWHVNLAHIKAQLLSIEGLGTNLKAHTPGTQAHTPVSGRAKEVTHGQLMTSYCFLFPQDAVTTVRNNDDSSKPSSLPAGLLLYNNP
jgi:hypothetical protein